MTNTETQPKPTATIPSGSQPSSPETAAAQPACTAAAAPTAGGETYQEDFQGYCLIKPKSKKAGIALVDTVPSPGTYQWYVENLSLVQIGTPECEALIDQKNAQNCKWLGTHRDAFEYLTKKGCKQGNKLEPGQEMWVMHQAKEYKLQFSRALKEEHADAVLDEAVPALAEKKARTTKRKEDAKVREAEAAAAAEAGDVEAEKAARNGKKKPAPASTGKEYFFIGRKVDPDSADALPQLVVTVDELWLKSAYHQTAMYKQLLDDLSRVCPNSYITRAGNGLLHIRVVMPTEEEINLASLIPGVQQIGLPDEENKVTMGKILKNGPGGVPLLHNQRGLCLMSGGIDSPVAAYKLMSRGVFVDGVHYLNSTSETGAVIAKNRKLAARLSKIQGKFTLRFVDINELQMAIVGVIKNQNRTLVYKWFMLHLSSILDNDNKVLITGDSLGQVASQTLTNLSSLYPGLRKPVMPPLMGMNKREIMADAHKIGTYELSIIQAADCCQFMMRKSQANLTIDQWTLYGEIAKVLRHSMPEYLPVTVDTFENGELVSSTQERFPFAQNATLLYETIDAKGRMGLNPMTGYRQAANSTAAAADDSAPAATEKPDLVALSDDAIADKYFGVEAPAVSQPVPAAADAANTAENGKTSPAPASKMTRAMKRLVTNGTVGGNMHPNRHEEAANKVWHFDSAAGTKICREAQEAVRTAPEGNPNALHASGRAARVAVEKVRAQIAAMLGKPASNIIFTSGGTESNAIALHGFNVQREDWSHSSTKASPVGSPDEGSPKFTTTVKVVDLVHHETGSVATNDMLKRPPGGRLHVDACQAFGKIQMKFFDLSEVDTMTFNSHKIHGPSGVGALYVKDMSSLSALWAGGAQEFGLRPGTENVAGIVGFGAALTVAEEFMLQEQEHYMEDNINKATKHNKQVDPIMIPPRRLKMENFITSRLKEMGCEVNSRGETVGYIAHATLPPYLTLENSDIVNALSTQYKLEIGTGSACNSSFENTTTYETLGVTPVPKRRSIRFSWDRYTQMEEAQYAMDALAQVIRQYTQKGSPTISKPASPL